MTDQIINFDASTTADNSPVVLLAAGDNLFLGRKGSLAAMGLGSEAIEGTNNRLTINGEVFAARASPIFLHGSNIIDIGSTGSIETALTAIFLDERFNFVTNRGEISGNLGIVIAGGANTISNFGTINSMGNDAIRVGGVAGDSNDIRNYGVISGSIAVAGGDGNDSVTNAGAMYGGVTLNGGSDSFDGRFGGYVRAVSGGAGNDFLNGSSLDDTFSGDDGADTLVGFRGDDALFGGNDNDKLNGAADNDWLVASAGADTLIGGAGGDRLVGGTGVDTASYETAGGRVTASLDAPYLNAGDAEGDSYEEIENLTGSALNDRLVGNSQNNVLDGGIGIDVMVGGLGRDTYFVDNAGDQITEAANGDMDTIRSSISLTLPANVENLVLLAGSLNGNGNGLDNTITGTSSANSLNGLAGNDTLAGGAGNDVLAGSAGGDTFFFNTGPNTTTNFDRLTDFAVAADTIQIENSVFAGIGAPGILAAAAFFTGSAAHDASDRVIYNSANGAVLFDADGNGGGAARKFAQLPTGLSVNNFDFIIV